MKKLFKAIRNKDLDLVKEIISGKPELVNCVAKQPPKKDDGQSPLQVALKVGAFEISDYLIDMGANLNFIEDSSCCNEWRAPVVHDAINAAVMTCRWNTNNQYTGFTVFSTEEDALKAYNVLKRMLEMGADVNSVDSYGNSGLWRFCLQAKQILPSYNYVEHRESDDKILTDELQKDLLRVLNLLCDFGADFSYVSPNTKQTVLQFYTEDSLAKLLNKAIG
ncbi:ankyrin repeat domain-containing protein [Oscillospiraceae bacterium LCP25S3_E10]|nr:ankyrin repeat domain-containing protein [Ruminococcus sp.]MDD6447192.1 ankyrin repeat domain-containing protein [Ruminococcus sp.]MDY2857078.1 ankyrin repeat domain-containing protein [Oscillospiraceae bacterium]